MYNIVCSPKVWIRLLRGIEDFSEAKVPLHTNRWFPVAKVNHQRLVVVSYEIFILVGSDADVLCQKRRLLVHDDRGFEGNCVEAPVLRRT